MGLIQNIHQEAIRLAKRFHEAESELLLILQKVDMEKVFLHLGYKSLFEYATQALKLSESNAYAFITVSRKSREVPQLQEAIKEGTLSVSKAKRVTSVIRPENQKEWIEKAQNLTQRDLEREVVKVNPRQAVPEKLTPVAVDRIEMRVGISEDLEKKLKRVQDLLSQRKKRAVSLEESIGEIADLFLEKKDPVLKARRVLIAKPSLRKAVNSQSVQIGKRRAIPAQIKHQVNQRDKGQCVVCKTGRWVELHHRIPVSHGGKHTESNLITLCAAHHRMHHRQTTLSSGMWVSAGP